MVVLFIQKMDGVSGSETYYLHILPELKRRGITPHFFLVQSPKGTAKNQDFIETLESQGIVVHTYTTQFLVTWGILKRIQRIIETEKIHIVQTNLIHADFYGAMTKLLFNRSMKLISTKHGFNDLFQQKHGFNAKKVNKFKLYYLTYRFSALFADKIVAISQGLADLITQSKITTADNIQVIRYGFDFEFDTSTFDRNAYRWGNPQAIIISRFVPYKQHSMVLALMPKILEKFPDFCLVLLGVGPLEAELKAQCNQLRISQRVKFLGFQPVHPYIEASDLMIFPSTSEGFGLVILESWFHNKAIIAFDMPAPNEIITANQDGILIPPYNQTLLLEAILDLLANPAKADALGRAGHEKLKGYYNLDIMATATIDNYTQVLNRPAV